MSDQPSELKPSPSNFKTGYIQWLIVSAVLITALSLLAVHLPERLKLLLVYAVVYGLISGGALATIAVKFGLPIKKTIILMIVCLVILGQSLILYLSHQRYQEVTLKRFKADQTMFSVDRMFATGKPPEDPESLKGYEHTRKLYQEAKLERQQNEKNLLLISSYLQHRISSVANLKTPWPQLFWIMELLFCCGSAIWASRQIAQSESKNTSSSDSPDAES
ncbi:hypothetical protein [uncultured Gimesia sp.]|uniref:hypothetical protein n=1 Tax=uncultured Gimesia sp. TaxID=1678688 RepID=UPI002607DD33|nr:hypothetical protein [uncultured Gimesia sp.]